MNHPASVSSGPRRFGRWTIETGVPGDGGLDAFNALAYAAAREFITAFSGFAEVRLAHADLMWVTPDGRPVRVVESAPVTVTEGVHLQIDGEPSLVTAVFIHSSLVAEAQQWGGLDSRSEGLSFVYACVTEIGGDALAPVDSAVTLTLTADLTGPEATDARGRLSAGLRDWERRTGRPINEWSSGVPGTGADRYGLRDDA